MRIKPLSYPLKNTKGRSHPPSRSEKFTRNTRHNTEDRPKTGTPSTVAVEEDASSAHVSVSDGRRTPSIDAAKFTPHQPVNSPDKKSVAVSLTRKAVLKAHGGEHTNRLKSTREQSLVSQLSDTRQGFKFYFKDNQWRIKSMLPNIIQMAIGIAKTVIGAYYLEDAYCKFDVPLFLLVSGVIFLSLTSFWICAVKYWVDNVLFDCFSLIQFVGDFGFLIWGSVVVFGPYSDWTDEDPTSENYCDTVPMIFAFVTLIFSWLIFVFLAVLYCCFILFSVAVVRSSSAEDDENPWETPVAVIEQT